MRTTNQLLAAYPIISDQIDQTGLRVVLEELETVLAANIAGDVVEFGCYIGTTSLFIRRLLTSYNQASSRQFHAYDSFAGLPSKAAADQSVAGDQFVAGALEVSKKQFIREFQRASLVAPTIHKQWFSQLGPQDVPATIAFAFLDGDFYDSILDSLRLVWPRMTPQGRVVIDDYDREALPGVTRAVQHYFGNQAPNITVRHRKAILQHP